MQPYVFVIDTEKSPCNPVHPAEARKLMREGKAAVWRRFPFTIILKEQRPGAREEHLVKIDPGSRATGIAVVRKIPGKEALKVVWACEIWHRGQIIKKKMESRRVLRRGRRNRKTRYREPRFDNRTRPGDWLPPSLVSRIANVETWVRRLAQRVPVSGVSVERVRFDTQKLQNPEISGAEYQQGELLGYEVREYLLEKWGRQCAYCGARNVPLEIEHLVPKSRGGSNRVSNLTLSCRKCNLKKGNRTAEEFGFPELAKHARKPLRDAAAVNATRWEIWRRLKSLGIPLEAGTGGQTKYHRSIQGYPKKHWIDAACTGASGESVWLDPEMSYLKAEAKGHGVRQFCNPDKFGFPRTKPKARQKHVFGFMSEDMAEAKVPEGRKKGTHLGRIVTRASGSFLVGKTDGVSWKYCQFVSKADGYAYSLGKPHSSHH